MLNFDELTPAKAMYTYADYGISTFPCNGKHPLTANGFKNATRSHDVIAQWEKSLKITGVGVPTGQENGFLVLDVDLKNDGPSHLEHLQEKHGPLPETLTVKTGGGGTHYYFRCPDATVKNSAGAIAPGIDIRANGGYVIVPPSLHATGDRYSFIKCLTEQSFKELPPIPEWLVPTSQISQPLARPASYWRDLMLNGVGEGQRNAAVASLSGHLLGRHIDPHVALYFVEQWNKDKCFPPLAEAEVHQVFESIVKAETKKRRRK